MLIIDKDLFTTGISDECIIKWTLDEVSVFNDFENFDKTLD